MIFKQKNRKTMHNKLVISLILAAFILNSATPAPTQAKTNSILLALKGAANGMIGVMADNIAIADSRYEFPISEERVPTRSRVVVATAYSSDPAQTDDTPCIPAMSNFDLCKNFNETGAEDTIAANFLPFGTHVRFPEVFGDKIFIVRDRMNSKYNGQHRIDFWMNDKNDAIQFGAKRMKMEIF